MTVECLPERVAKREAILSFPCGDAPAPGSTNEVAPGVLWIRIPLPSGQFVNAWALRDDEGWAVVDTGMSTGPARETWQQLLSPAGPLHGRSITRVIGTHLHADHVGLAGWLCEQFACDLWMTRTEYLQACRLELKSDRPVPAKELAFYRRAGWDAETLAAHRPMGRNMWPLPPSFTRIADGDVVRIGADDWQVLVGSGHSPEHACLYCAERGLLISGDQVLPLISSNVSVWPMEPGADPMRDWLDAIEKIRRLVPDDVLVLPAHDDPFLGLHVRLDQLAHKRHKAMARLRAALAAAPLRAADAFATLFGRQKFDNVFVQQLATGEAIAYLNHLVQRVEIVVRDDDEGVAWYQGVDR